MTVFTWGDPQLPLTFHHEPDQPVTLSCVAPDDWRAVWPTGVIVRRPMVELLVLGEGRALTTLRTDRTVVGDGLRYVTHRTSADDGAERLEVVQLNERAGVEVTTRLERLTDGSAYRATATVRNVGEGRLVLQGVTSVVLSGLTPFLGDNAGTAVWSSRAEWCGENRWSSVPVTGPAGLPDINVAAHRHAPRGTFARSGQSTWSTGEFLPVAGLVHEESGRAVFWEIENNGPWRWEVSSQFRQDDWLTVALLGPTDLEHSWTTELEPGAEFTTVPASFALSADGLAGAVGELTRHRRRSHVATTADAGRPLVFNDYMNALMGDPTTEKLLPLVDAAAAVGAEYFCIDAGWYDDGYAWWPSVGAWEPSVRRFGDLGLQGVLQYIRDAGMRPGLWIEPEVIGVRSPRAAELPEECFMHRRGVRIVEHDRYFLDLRSAKAREYLDSVFDRLVGELGARYFKWDYNVTPGTGPDTGVSSPGEGLLDHARAHLEWFEALRRRHPDVIFEACSSGAQRMDQAILARYDLQSTSDQQDYRLYPAIAASAPMALRPEQAGNWAYPQSEMTLEQVAFNLVTGLSGRLYLSGNLDKLDDARLGLVREATGAYHDVLDHHARALPQWPLGLPTWDAPAVALASATDDQTLVFVWNRDEAGGPVHLDLPRLAGREVVVETVFPKALPEWSARWDAAAGRLVVDAGACGESARVLRVTVPAEV